MSQTACRPPRCLNWPPAQLLEEPRVGLSKCDGAVAQDLRRHVSQKRRPLGNELAVSLIDGNRLAGGARHTPGKLAEVAVFFDLGVVDPALTPDPAEQDARLRVVRLQAKLVAVQHLVPSCHRHDIIKLR